MYHISKNVRHLMENYTIEELRSYRMEIDSEMQLKWLHRTISVADLHAYKQLLKDISLAQLYLAD